jgi:hypothetical protein
MYHWIHSEKFPQNRNSLDSLIVSNSFSGRNSRQVPPATDFPELGPALPAPTATLRDGQVTKASR